MWLLSVAQLLTFLAPGGSADPSEAVPPGQPEPIQTRQTYFAIPFEIDQIDHPTLGAVEIQLCVSRDRGVTWEHANSVPPTTKYFLFRAAGDGEYWFAVRTRDRSGSFRPAQIEGPGLRVVVDTQAPGLAIDARRGAAGEIVAKWQIDEPNLAPESLKIQYRVGDSRQCETIAIDTASLRPGVATNSGEATWWAPAGQGRVEIRAEVADAAGNRNVSHAQVLSGPSAAPPHEYAAAGPSQLPPASPADGPQVPAQNDWQPSASQQAGPRDTPPPQQQQYPQQQTVAMPGDEAGGYPVGAAAPKMANQAASHSPSGTPYPEHGDPQVYNHFPAAPPGERQANPNVAGESYPAPVDQSANPRPSSSPPPDWGQTAGAAPMHSTVAVQPAPAYQKQYLPGGASGPSQQPAGGAPEGVPAIPRPVSSTVRAVASRLFEIDYSGLQQPTAVSRVELWGSRDGGRTWENYGVDPDGLSPMIARVPEEGTYGFKFVFHPVHGPAARPPWPGDAPDITIRVDLTRPQARLLGVERNRHDARRITIRWQASDSQLADMPISLYYADMARSQWRPIATNLRNVGSYEWTLPPNLPEQIQIRLDVEDVAGNLTTAETRNGIPLASGSQVGTSAARQPVPVHDMRPAGQPQDDARQRSHR